ncbi:hypothetical protein P8452_64517 [Trifolium repens]|nr:hypothetical protein P8452_64517 [Trifolium repens]
MKFLCGVVPSSNKKFEQIIVSRTMEGNLHNVHSLRLKIDQVNYRNDSIPTFHNLTQLEFSCSSLHYNWKFLVEVLNHCPKLQKLDLKETYLGEEPWIRKDDKQNWVDPDFVPQCSLDINLKGNKLGGGQLQLLSKRMV